MQEHAIWRRYPTIPPGNGMPVFETVSKAAIIHKLGCVTSINIWKNAVVYNELTINERQKTDREFSFILDCVRRGFPTDEMINTAIPRL